MVYLYFKCLLNHKKVSLLLQLIILEFCNNENDASNDLSGKTPLKNLEVSFMFESKIACNTL